MSSLSELIERVKAATGPDRRLDAEIDCAIRFPYLRPAEPDDHKEFQRGFPPSPGDIWCPTGFLMARSYTRSLDDALTLVPENHGYYIRENCSSDGDEIYCNAQVWPYSDPRDDGAPRYWANSKQGAPALALVAACLKARLLDAASSEVRG